MMKNISILLLFFLSGLFVSCDKFLDEKPNKKDVVPSTLEDLQALLDYYNTIRNDPFSGEIASDDYYLTDADWSGLSYEEYRRGYVWQKDHATLSNDWFNPFRNVYWANIILDAMDKIEKTVINQSEWNSIKGQALFLRARGLLSVAAIWAKPYVEGTASTDLGIPLRTTADFNVPSERASVKDTYSQIIEDLQTAAELLPVSPIHVMRSSRPAALALLARTSLFMRDYSSCLEYSDECLKLKHDLLDYNELSSTATYPFPPFNKEIIYFSWLPNPPPLTISRAKIDSVLYRSYSEDDLRRSLYFRKNSNGSYAFRGSYTAGSTPFSGISVDEVYLMRAESNARLNNISAAMNDLNTLMASRWVKNKFSNFSADNKEAAINLILKERRKELIFRGLRWPDIKRLNLDDKNIVLKRMIGGQEYTLSANDPRFQLPIPEDVIEKSGIQQNP